MANYEKWVPANFKDSALVMSTTELETAILDATKAIKSVEEDRENDDKLQSLKETLSDLNGGYNDTLKTLKAKVNYALAILATRGQTVRLDPKV